MGKIAIIMGGYPYRIPFQGLGYSLVHTVDPLFKSPKQVSLVVFSGGEDVHPSLYKGIDRGFSYTSLSRDAFEKGVFNQCRLYNIKMVGICRGFQFLNVMAGGQMYQHLEGHGLFGRHPAYFPFLDKTMFVSSTHHQLVKLNDDAVPLTWADPKRSKIYIGPDSLPTHEVEQEMEGAIFPNSNAMGVQYHPEMMESIEPACALFTDIVADFMKLTMNQMISIYDRRAANDSGRVEGIAKAAGGGEAQGN